MAGTERFHKKTATAGQTLIGLLVALAIVAVLAVLFIPRIAGRHHGPGQPLTPRERGYQAACVIYEAQINQAIMMFREDRGDNPPSLDALKQYGLTDDMIHAPDCVFTYDPATGIARNSAEGALGVGGIANPASPAQAGTPGSQAPAAPAYNGPPIIAPPGASNPPTHRRWGPDSDGQTRLPGGINLPNISGGMGGAGSDD